MAERKYGIEVRKMTGEKYIMARTFHTYSEADRVAARMEYATNQITKVVEVN